MADGLLKLSRTAARGKAAEMKKIGADVLDLLDRVSKKMEEIDSVEHGVYQGDNRPAQLRAELDSFRGLFNLAYDQIVKFADNVIETVNKAENE